MNTIKPIRTKFATILMLCLSSSLLTGIGCGEDAKCPVKVEIINKEEAKYDSPENSYAAMISALTKKDLSWYYETLTEESATNDKKDFQESGIDPQKNFDLAKGTKADFIIDKLPYKHGVLLICESHQEDGSIITGPSIFVKENGLWKATFEFSSDEKLWDYIDYVKPEGK